MYLTKYNDFLEHSLQNFPQEISAIAIKAVSPLASTGLRSTISNQNLDCHSSVELSSRLD